MSVTTTTEQVQRQLHTMSHTILVLQHTDHYKCDHCKREYVTTRYDGQGREMRPFACVCKKIVTV